MKPNILVIRTNPDEMVQSIEEAFGESVDVITATTGLAGFFNYQQYNPCIVLVDESLPDMNGMSVATIIKDTAGGAKSLVYLFIEGQLWEHTRADRFISKPEDKGLLLKQLKTDIKKINRDKPSDSLLNAIQQQNDMLPKAISNSKFTIESIFSAYDHLSGDSINFWYKAADDKGNADKLYGYLFDCEGHTLSSYGQVGSTWLSMKKSMWNYQVGIYKSLSDVLRAVNQDFVTLYDKLTLVPTICFCVDFRANVMHYAPAGIPYIHVKKKGEKCHEAVLLQSPILGYEMDSEFCEYELPLDDVTEVVLSSDGLSDLLIDHADEEPLEIAKNDDVSAIYIRLGHRSEDLLAVN